MDRASSTENLASAQQTGHFFPTVTLTTSHPRTPLRSSSSQRLSAKAGHSSSDRQIPEIVIENLYRTHPIYKTFIDFDSPHTVKAMQNLNILKEMCIVKAYSDFEEQYRDPDKRRLWFIHHVNNTYETMKRVLEERNRLKALDSRPLIPKNLQILTPGATMPLSLQASTTQNSHFLTFDDRLLKVKENYDRQHRMISMKGLGVLKDEKERFVKDIKLKNKMENHEKFFRNKSAERLRHFADNKRKREEFTTILRQKRREDENLRQSINFNYNNNFAEETKRKQERMKEYMEELDKKWEKERELVQLRRSQIEQDELQMTLDLEEDLKYKDEYHQELLRNQREEERAESLEKAKRLQQKMESVQNFQKESSMQQFEKMIVNFQQKAEKSEKTLQAVESKFQDKVAEMREKRRQVLEHVEATRRSFRNKLRSSENKAKERFHKLDGFLSEQKQSHQESVAQRQSKYSKSTNLAIVAAQAEVKNLKILSRHRMIEERLKNFQNTKEELIDLARLTAFQISEDRNALLSTSKAVTHSKSPIKALRELNNKTRLTKEEVSVFTAVDALTKARHLEQLAPISDVKKAEGNLN